MASGKVVSSPPTVKVTRPTVSSGVRGSWREQAEPIRGAGQRGGPGAPTGQHGDEVHLGVGRGQGVGVPLRGHPARAVDVVGRGTTAGGVRVAEGHVAGGSRHRGRRRRARHRGEQDRGRPSSSRPRPARRARQSPRPTATGPAAASWGCGQTWTIEARSPKRVARLDTPKAIVATTDSVSAAVERERRADRACGRRRAPAASTSPGRCRRSSRARSPSSRRGRRPAPRRRR